MLIDFRTLFPKYNIHPKGVLHVGANIGEEASVYTELGINKQIWVEGNPDLLDILKTNVLKGSEKYVLQFLAGDENKEVVLHISNNSGQSSSVLNLGTHLQAHPEVHYIKDEVVIMKSLDSFFVENTEIIKGVDFLNLDVQGFEGKVLNGLGSWINEFKWIYTEVNCRYVYENCTLIQDLDSYLSKQGFYRAETFGESGFFQRLGWSDALYIRQ